MRNKTLSLRLAFVLLLISMNTLRQMFSDSWALGFWALVVDLLILLVIVGEILIRWWLKRRHTLADETVLDFLALDKTGFPKTVEQISAGTQISPKKTKASLRRLKAEHQVDMQPEGWRKVNY